MIPHRAETSRFVVTEQLLGGVIPGGACGAAMNDDIFHGSGGCHHRAVLLSEESTFFGISSSPIIIGKVS